MMFPQFEDYIPDKDWGREFALPSQELLSLRMCEYISRKRAEICVEKVNSFF